MTKNRSITLQLFYLILIVLIVLLPLIIWRLNLPIIESTYDGSSSGTIDSEPFELFGFFVTVTLSYIAFLQVKNRSKKTVLSTVPIILPLLTLLSLLFIQSENFHLRSSDYMCYENAAKAVISGTNPYHGNPSCYLYPPLLAQVLAFVNQVATHNPLFTFDKRQEWTVVSYFYECGQFFQIILAYILTSLLSKKLGMKALPALFLTTFLFLFNYPLIRTILFEQVNLYILNSFLLGIFLLQKYPFLSGLAVAVGAHIKLYTLVLLFPWSFTKKIKAIFGVFFGFIFIGAIQVYSGNGWILWQQFILYFRNPEKPSNYRNNSIWSLIYNFEKIPFKVFKNHIFYDFTAFIVSAILLIFLAWFITRLIRREQIYSRMTNLCDDGNRSRWHYIFRLYGHSIDAIALSLLISPSVWEHHYVLAIPIAVLAVSTCRQEKLPWNFLGVFLIFCIPSVEIFPLSFHRLIGLIVLVYLTSPDFIKDYFILKSTNTEIKMSQQLV